jgi:hypothetical protein
VLALLVWPIVWLLYIPLRLVGIGVEMKQMHKLRQKIAGPLFLLMSGCTTQAWYEGFKISAESECYQQPLGVVSECLSRLNKKTHEEYEKERSSK